MNKLASKPEQSTYRTKLALHAKPNPDGFLKPMLEAISVPALRARRIDEFWIDNRAYVKMAMLSTEERRILLADQPNMDITKTRAPGLFGPLIEKKSVDKATVYAAGLLTNIYGTEGFQCEQDAGKAPIILLDTTMILEMAIARINFFRFFEPERPEVNFGLLGGKEIGAKDALREKLEGIFPKGEFTLEQFKKAKLTVNSSPRGEPATDETAFHLIKIIRYLGQPVHSTYADNEVTHTLNLCNLIARNTLMTAFAMFNVDLQFGSSMNNASAEKITDPIYTMVGELAACAYGNPFLALGEMDKYTIMKGPDVNAMFFAAIATKRMIQELSGKGPDLGAADEAQQFSLAGVSENRLREVAKYVIKDVGPSDEPDFAFSIKLSDEAMGLIKAAGSMNIFTEGNFPLMLQTWKELHFDEKNRATAEIRARV